MEISIMKRFVETFASFIIRWKFLVLLIIIGMTAFLGYHVKYFKLVNDPDTFSPPDHPNMVFNRWAEKNFGMGTWPLLPSR